MSVGTAVHIESRYATTMYNRYARVKARFVDVLGRVEHFQLSFATYLELTGEVRNSDDWRRLGRVERARLDGYMDARFEAIQQRMVWVLHSQTDGYLFQDALDRNTTGAVDRNVPWSTIDGGCHYWPPKNPDSQTWRPWGDPDDYHV